MPVFLAALIGGLVSAAGSLVGRILIALGVSYVSYKGLDVLFSGIQAAIQSNISGLPSGVIGLMGILKIGTSINIIFSAIVVRLTLGGLTSGAVKKMVLK